MVSALLYRKIDDVSILIDRRPNVVVLAPDGNERFIDLPDVHKPSLFLPERSSVGRPRPDAY